VIGRRLASPLSPRGSDAATIADLWWLMVVLGALAFAVFAVGLFVGLRRRGERAAGGRPDDHRHVGRERSTRASRAWIVGGGVALPAVVIGIVLGATFVAMRSMAAADEDPELTVDVIGHQFWWEVRYPDLGVVTANEVHVPADTTVEITLRSADVIHSFWVPAVAGKVDLLPERVNRLVIDAEPGTYEGRCAEFCGTSHANMDFLLVAHAGDAFDRWVAEQLEPAAIPTDTTATRGAEQFSDAGCAKCHTISGTDAAGTEGPDLTHLASRQTILGGAADPTMPDLVEWITDPHSVKPGARMPATRLDDDQIEELVAYLDQLR
jgi:cytochrome c oxidase subunit II